MTDPQSRRQFLSYLAASPLFLGHPERIGHPEHIGHPERSEGSALRFERLTRLLEQAQEPTLIPTARHALNVFDFEPVAKQKLPPAHWAYLATGSDDDGTIRANREGFGRYELRVRRLVDVSKIDTSVDLYGKKWPTPIVMNPIGSQRAFHPEGELASARAAKALNHLQVLSTVGTTSIEDMSAARGEPVWFQLYHRQDWSQTLQMIKRAERAGCPAVAFTVDLLGGSNRETQVRGAQGDTRDCTRCHAGGQPRPGMVSVDFRDNRRKPMLADFTPGTSTEPGTPTWDYVKRIKDATSMKVLLKGIVTREDGELAVENGIDGIFVSNHGGRAENSQRATIVSLPEVVTGVNGRIPIIVDGGFRRGTDIFKGLALGATKVGVGRPYIWGLAAFGQEGVEVVLTLLRRELELVMRQAGTVSVKRISRDYVVAAR
ncbi:MAG: alpha-hydroxy acid oxidase [Gemmatimonadaceae bacterium]